MIDLEQYRARIGLGGIQRGPKKFGLIPSICIRTMVLTKSVLLTAWLLLAISGVERNPGPANTVNSGTTSEIPQGHQGGRPKSTNMAFATVPLSDPSFDIVAHMKAMSTDISTIKVDISDLKKEMNTRFEKVEVRTDKLEKSVEDLDSQVLDLKMKLLEDNLIFKGIQEAANETDDDTETKVRNFITEDLNLKGESMEFKKIYRQGKKVGTRAILVKFASSKDRQAVFDTARQITDLKSRIKRDLPKEVREARRALAPLYEDAQRQNFSPKIVCNKMFVNGKTFRVDKITHQVVEENTE